MNCSTDIYEGNEDLFRRIFEFQKCRYEEDNDSEGVLELRFFFLGKDDKINKNISFEIYEKMIELGVLEYNWDTVPFSVSFERIEDIECVKFSINVNQNYLDEWYAIYLGIKVTEKIGDLALSVSNESGDSILVHLADKLPRCIRPYNSKNRCFALNGRIYLIDHKLYDMSSKFMKIKLSSALKKLNDMNIQENKIMNDTQVCEDEYTDLFMKKYELISRINEKEKRHNFNVILPIKVAEMILKFHYLISVSLKHLFEYGNDTLEIRELERETDLNSELMDIFYPNNLVRVRICITRPQYSKLFNEGMLIKTPIAFSKKSWMNIVSKMYTDDTKKLEREVLFGRLITFGLYIAYMRNPRHSLSIFCWTYSNNDYWSLVDKKKIKSYFISFSKKSGFCTFDKENGDIINSHHFQDLWRNFILFKENDENILNKLFSNNNIIDDSTEWLNNDEYTKSIIEDVQLAYSYGSKNRSESNNSNFKCKESFSDFLKKESYFEEIDSYTFDEDSNSNKSDFCHNESEGENDELTDYSLDASIDEDELAEFEVSMKQMDEELRRTLKTTVPVLGAEEGEEFVEKVCRDTLNIEKTLGILGPASILNKY
ncbi:hypothetical protein FG379_000111 [Cryptosporidium bovis]|uniref:uncharacterized protein n=1 Tax=Cryptosporidium bovis TaxID=310047 RepID=UPI003519F88A|nr:hypothetical protein FG379_000111 [Cryptosporidium bovis]